MTYLDSIFDATQRALDDWGDVPDALLPLVITSGAAYLSGTHSDPVCDAGWR